MARKPWKFSFTYADIAQAAGKSVEAVKLAKRAGEFAPGNFRSVLDWLLEKRESGQVGERDRTP
jgi:hypothetical protein